MTDLAFELYLLEFTGRGNWISGSNPNTASLNSLPSPYNCRPEKIGIGERNMADIST